MNHPAEPGDFEILAGGFFARIRFAETVLALMN